MPSGLNWTEVMALLRREERKGENVVTARQRQALKEGRDESGRLTISFGELLKRLDTGYANARSLQERGAARLVGRYGKPESASVSLVVVPCNDCGREIGAFWYPDPGKNKAPYALGWPRCLACAMVAALPKDEEGES